MSAKDRFRERLEKVKPQLERTLATLKARRARKNEAARDYQREHMRMKRSFEKGDQNFTNNDSN